MEKIRTDILVIGGGAGGLSVAAVASQMGAKVVLAETHKMGGDCLNTGCVPSKALIASSKLMWHAQHAKILGIGLTPPIPDFRAIHQHIDEVIDTIKPHDSVERFESLGVKVIKSQASFKDTKTLIVGEYEVSPKYTVIATGSSPKVPPIQGLSDIAYLTNETIFNLKEKPKTLAIMGGGPIGSEIASAYALLGVPVTLLEAGNDILSTIDNEARALIKTRLTEHGVTIKENCQIDAISKEGADIHITTHQGLVKASHLLVATGRRPNLTPLNLDIAGIDYTQQGITVDKRMRTTQKRIYAIGDVASPYQFTHAASYQAGIVIKNILFKLPAKVKYDAFPRAIYTTPEIAHVGISFEKAQSMHAQILTYALKDNDRAIAEKDTEGFIKLAVGKKGRVLAVTIIGTHAADLLTPWIVAIQSNLTIKDMASFIAPYPTLSEASKRVAGSYYTPFLYAKKTKRIVRFLLRYF